MVTDLISAEAAFTPDPATPDPATGGPVADDPVTSGMPAGLSYSGLRKAYLLRTSADQKTAQFSTELLSLLLAKLAARVVVDEVYYRERYPDIGEAIAAGQFVSARHHYVRFGYMEDRMPHRIEVDDVFYRKTNPDVVAGLRSGRLVSAQLHFEHFGFKEGRLPYEGWSLF
jgi:hypothetical protein